MIKVYEYIERGVISPTNQGMDDYRGRLL